MLALTALAFALSGGVAARGVCSPRALSVVCSLWPVYDFARNVAEGTGTEVQLLLPPGAEAHSFTPRPSDIKALNDAGLFIYTGEDMEPWAVRLRDTLKGTVIVNASEGAKFLPAGGHDHGHGHGHGFDPHVWLDLSNAQTMVRNTALAMCAADPEREETYRGNAEAYCAKLDALDREISALAGEGGRVGGQRALVFAGRFAYKYFLTRYGLDYVSAYDGETEPGPRGMAAVIRYIAEHGVKVIFRDELPMSSVTREIAEQTGAELRIFHTCHNLTRDEFEKGVSFLDVMRANAVAVAEALRE